MQIEMTAMLKTKQEFLQAYSPGDCHKMFSSGNLLTYALQNSRPDSYDISHFLLDEGIDPTVATRDGQTALHLLFARVRHDLNADIVLAERLIRGGTDINALDKNNESALVWLINMKFTDEQLSPLYDLWFSRPQKILTVKSRWGKSPLDLAGTIPYRSDLLRRIQDALSYT